MDARLLEAAIVLPLLAILLTACGASPDPRPNVLVYVLDDATPSMMTARLQAIAAEGVRFDSSIVESPLCAPARASILSGLHTHNHGVTGNLGGAAGWTANGDGRTIADWFAAAGYVTVRAGKWINGVPRNGHSAWSATIHSVRSLGDPGGINDLTARTVELVASTSAPMLVYFAPTHDWVNPDPKYAGTYAGTPPLRDPNFNEDDVSDKRWDVQPLLSDVQITLIDFRYRRSLETMESVVDSIQTLRAAFDGRPLYVVVVSDNGHEDGQHRLASGKGTHFEESIRVPLFILGPGIAPTVSSALVSPVDIAPTIAELSGCPVPELDGRSLVPLLAEPSAPWRDRVLLDHGFRGVRTAQQKLVFKGFLREYYDLATDPWELRNLCAVDDLDCGLDLATFIKPLLACRGHGCWLAETADAATVAHIPG